MADPLQLNLKIAIFFSFVREKKKLRFTRKNASAPWAHFFCLDFGTKTFFDMLGNLENCEKWVSSLKKKSF